MVVELSDCNIKLCHSLGCPDDCPNWRSVPGFPVFGVGQPSEEGFAKIVERVPKEKVIWFNMRQEPVAYIGGQPVTPRKSKNPHGNLEIGGQVSDMEALEVKLVELMEGRKCVEGNIDIFRDKEDRDNPMDREEIKESCKLDNLQGFTQILSKLADGPIKGMQIIRVPILEEKALPEECFDVIVKSLVDQNPAKTQCIFSSQLGKSRTTLGMTIACITKAVQMSAKLDKMVETGIGSKDWAEHIIHHMFEEPNVESEDLKDPNLMGEFDVIKELLEKWPETKEGKILADKMIDMCGIKPEGTGILNLRKCIIQTKYKYDAASEDRQTVWKKMIINFIERYFYLVCFATYARENGKDGFKKTFVEWINEKYGLREMIAQGKDKLEWERMVDSTAVNALRNQLCAPNEDFIHAIGDIIYRLYKISHETYKDMPRGQIKDTLMRKLTCKTLMEILPPDLLSAIQKEMTEKKLTSDFETVVGLIVSVKC